MMCAASTARGDNSQHTARAAVVIGDDGATEAWGARFAGVARFGIGQLQLLELAAGLGEQFAAVQKGFLVRGIALPKQRLRRFVEMRVDQGGAQNVAILFYGQQSEQVIVQSRTGGPVRQTRKVTRSDHARMLWEARTRLPQKPSNARTDLLHQQLTPIRKSRWA
jgi:hypothetical protein